MKLTIETAKLQNLIAKALKGASCNKMIPITSLIGITAKDNELELVTTDATNYLYVRSELDTLTEEFETVVPIEVFSKLIARLTCDMVTLEVENDILTVFGNGKYSIELPLNEEGKSIKYPKPKITAKDEDVKGDTITLSDTQFLLNTAKFSVSTALDVPCYTGYYVGDKVVTTDTYKICSIDTKLLGEPRLLSASTVELFSLFTSANITVIYNSADEIEFMDEGITIYSKCMDCISDYQINAIQGLLDETFDSVVRISKKALLQTLDRLALFVGVYDKNAVTLTFTRDALVISSKQVTGTDTIPYQSSENFKDFVCSIDIEMLQTQVKANMGDVLTLHYGRDNAVKLTDEKVTQIIALLED